MKGDHITAEKFAREGLEVDAVPINPITSAGLHGTLGVALGEQGKTDEAKRELSMSIEAFEAVENARLVAQGVANLGYVWIKSEDWNEAEACFHRAIEIGHRHGPSVAMAIAHHGIARVRLQLGDLRNGIAALAQVRQLSM